MNRENDLSSGPTRRIEAAAGQEEGQELNVEESSINGLPPEMLMKILRFVDTRSLFACRLVNRNFSSISSPILCHRPDAQICFEFMKANKFLRCDGKRFRLGQNNLLDFLGCLKKSKNCPFAHFAFAFSFYAEPAKFLDHPDFTELLSYFSSKSSSSRKSQIPSQKIKSLDLKFCGMNDDVFETLAPKLGDLLLNKTPFVENLYLGFGSTTNHLQFKLFPTRNQIPVSVESKFQLAHLKVLRFKSRPIANYSGILEELLSAAVSLEKIYLYEPKIPPGLPISLEDFELLESLGKFHLLKNFEFYLSEECLKRVTLRLDFTRALFNLELEELELLTPPANLNLNVADNYQATSFISSLFQSSKDSLKKLKLGSLGKFTALQFPKFKNLTQLKLEQQMFLDSNPFFPPGIRALDIFPAVRQLDLPGNWCSGFADFESIPVFPSVKNLSVVDTGFGSHSISVLVLLCPNLKHLRIHRDRSDDSPSELKFLSVALEIWKLMTQLESLEIDIKIDSSENSSAQFDLCFTGISVENVQRLYQMRAETRKKWKLWETWKRKSESELAAKWRKHPSILNMKCLTKLTINAYAKVSDRWTKMDKEDFYTTHLTWISHDYAFKLLPQLKLS